MKDKDLEEKVNSIFMLAESLHDAEAQIKEWEAVDFDRDSYVTGIPHALTKDALRAATQEQLTHLYDIAGAMEKQISKLVHGK
jgi:hypothetical protein